MRKAILALGIASVLNQTLAQDVITVTVHKTCETTTFFPTYGWVTTNGTTSPYTFSPGTSAASVIPTVTNTRTSIPSTVSTITERPFTFTSRSAILLASSNPVDQASSQGSGIVVPVPTPPISFTPGGTTGSPTTNSPSPPATSTCVTAAPSDISCPQANGTLYTPAGRCVGSNDTFVVFCAVEFVSGGLIRLEDIQSDEVCIALCSEDANCVAVAFDTSDNSCYQKNAVVMGNATANPNLIFAIRAAVYYPPGEWLTLTTPSATSYAQPTSDVSATSSSFQFTSVSSTLMTLTSSTTPVSSMFSVTGSTRISISLSDTLISSFVSASGIAPTPSQATSSPTRLTSAPSSDFGRTTTYSPSTGSTASLMSTESSSKALPSPFETLTSVTFDISQSTMDEPSSTSINTNSTTTLAIETAITISPDGTSLETMLTSSQLSASQSTTFAVPSSTVLSATSMTPVPSLCPAANQTTYNNDNSHNYIIYCDVTSTGSFRTIRLANFVDCISACNLDESCAAVSFTDGVCEIISPPIRLTYSPGSQFAARSGSVQDTTTTTATTPTSESLQTVATSSTMASSSETMEVASTTSAIAWTSGSTQAASTSAPSASTSESGQAVTTATTTTTTGPATSSSEMSSPGPTFTSPPIACIEGATFNGINGRQYVISCQSDTSGNGGAVETVNFLSGDFTQCADECDQRTYCGAWVWGGPGGAGEAGGACYLEEAPQAPIPGRDGMVAGILVGEQSSASSISSTSSSAQSSSDLAASMTLTQSPVTSEMSASSSTSSADISTILTTTTTTTEISTTTTSSTSISSDISISLPEAETSSLSSLSSSSSTIEMTATTTSEITTTSSSLSTSEAVVTTFTTTSAEISSSSSDLVTEPTTTTTTTDVAITTTTSSTTIESFSSSTPVSPSATCGAQDGASYQAVDTSSFILLCNRAYQRLYLPGSPIQLLNPTLEACTERCAAQGTDCAGATFGSSDGSQPQCYLYSKMLETDEPTSPVTAVVRTSNADGALGRREILDNGGFDGTLSPWTSGTANDGTQFTVTNSAAAAIIASGESNTLSQEISQPAVGNAGYYFFMDVGVTPSPGSADPSSVSCQIDVQNALGDLFYRESRTPGQGVKTLYGSGTIQQGGILNLVINVQCTGTAASLVTIDNIAFYVFQAIGGSDSGCSSGSSILQNGGFDTDFPPWTTSQSGSTSATFSVSGGQAIVQFSAGAFDNTLASISQSAIITSNTNYLLTSDLYFTISAQGSCAVGFANEFENLYYTGQITDSQRLLVNFDGVSDIASSQVSITISCAGPGVNQVGIDSVGLVLSPGQDCPMSTTIIPGVTSTSFSTTVTESSTSTDPQAFITTTSSTTSSTVSSSSTPSGPTSCPTCNVPAPGTAPTASCPGNEGLRYTTSDGSEWMLVCDRDYGGSDIQSYGVPSLTDCINLCITTGSTCVGVSFISGGIPPMNICYTKYEMNPSLQPAYVVDSAVRVRGPTTGSSSPTQLLGNGCFDNDLSCWEGHRPENPASATNFLWGNGAAYVDIFIDQTNPQPLTETASLYQNVSAASQGDIYYLALAFSSSGYVGNCHFYFLTDSEALTQRDYSPNDPIPATGTIYASGTLTATPILFWFTYSCEDDGGSPVDAWVSVDYVSFTFRKSNTVNPPDESATTTASDTSTVITTSASASMPSNNDASTSITTSSSTSASASTSTSTSSSSSTTDTLSSTSASSSSSTDDIISATTSSPSSSTDVSTSATTSSSSSSTSFSTSITLSSSSSIIASSSSSTSATPSPSVRATVSCPANDGQTYTNDDGSQFMIVCGQGYDGNNIVGINPVAAGNFSSCVDLCMYQGTACTGVTWFNTQANCYLKSRMSPSMNQGAVVYSAIRVSGPAAGPASSRIVTNGEFTTDLSSWTTSQQTQQGGSFVWNDGKAYVSLNVAPDDFFGGSDSAALSQDIAGANSGQVYFMTAQVNIPGSIAYCNVQCTAGQETMFGFSYDQSAQYGAVNASGILQSTPTNLVFTIYCYDYSGSTDPVNTWTSFDNVQFSVYNPSQGTNPIRALPREGLVNNDFGTGSFSPWTTYDRTGRMTFTVTNNAARITWNRIDARFNSQSYIQQTLSRPSEAGQVVRVQADVYFYIPNSGTNCYGAIYAGGPFIWFLQNVVTTQAVHVDATVTLTSGSTIFTLEGNCVGTGSTTYMSFDNVYFTLNAQPT